MENPLELIAKNYNELNQMMVKEIELATAHPGLTGSYREEMWKKFFRSIIPLKFSFVHGAMIIDSEGNISNEVDIAVIDEQYTPYIFQYHTLKLIPIEAVSMVIECKSTELPSKQLSDWADSIKNLEAKNTGIARMATGYSTGVTNLTQSRSQPIKVLVSIKSSVKNFTMETTKADLGEHFDFILQEQIDTKSTENQERRKEFKVLVKNENRTLGWWAKRLNHHESSFGDRNIGIDGYLEVLGDPKTKVLSEEHKKMLKTAEINVSSDNKHITNTLGDLKIEENPLLTLNLQLNQLLMLTNNPMLFPHFAYAKAFKKVYKKLDQE